MIQIYLAIIETYLCFTFTWILVVLFILNKEWKDVKLDNQLWKKEIRWLFKKLEIKIKKSWK